MFFSSHGEFPFKKECYYQNQGDWGVANRRIRDQGGSGRGLSISLF